MAIDTAQLLQEIVTFLPRIQRLQKHLSPTTQSVLLALAEHGALNLTSLASIRDVKKSTMSVMMDQLTQQQLVIKARSKNDRRQHIYMLSRQGRDLLQQEWQYKSNWLRETLSTSSQAEIDNCKNLLQIISAAAIKSYEID